MIFENLPCSQTFSFCSSMYFSDSLALQLVLLLRVKPSNAPFLCFCFQAKKQTKLRLWGKINKQIQLCKYVEIINFPALPQPRERGETSGFQIFDKIQRVFGGRNNSGFWIQKNWIQPIYLSVPSLVLFNVLAFMFPLLQNACLLFASSRSSRVEFVPLLPSFTFTCNDSIHLL